MSQLLVVFGATGQQGGSVIDAVTSDTRLSKEYKIRGVTRDKLKPASQKLEQKGCEVVQADIDDKASLEAALKGAHTVFGVTVSIYTPGGKQKELEQGKLMADVAVGAGAQYYIFSSVPSVTKHSNGTMRAVAIFDVKEEIESYIRSLPIKSAFFSPASFMQNFATMAKPRPNGDGTYSYTNLCAPSTKLPLIDIASDTGKFVGAILAEPQKYEGKTFAAATRLYSLEEQVQIMTKVSGKTVTYRQVPDDVFKSFLPPTMAEWMTQMWQYNRDYGYYGKDMQEEVEWSARQARGKLTELEDYFGRNPLELE